MTLHELTHLASSARSLGRDEIQAACDLLLDEKISIEERANFLAALHARGETPDEVATFVEILLTRAVPVPFSGAASIDVCGTGGDKAGFFNISTTVMFVVAGAGARVIKHGNRGITSKSGGADVLEALGMKIDLTPEAVATALEAAGCCFLFAPAYHPAFRAVVPVRKLLAERGSASIFNIIGPLLNPARPEFQLAGVYDRTLLPTYAGSFKKLGRKRAWAVHGTGPNGLVVDELSPFGTSKVIACDAGELSEFEIDPADFGMRDMRPADLIGGNADENASIILSILEGKNQGSQRLAVQLNAAAALVVSGKATDMQTAWNLAGASIDEGRAWNALANLRAASK
jgi:anthranilate phosphoribosyltransferase